MSPFFISLTLSIFLKPFNRKLARKMSIKLTDNDAAITKKNGNVNNTMHEFCSRFKQCKDNIGT